MTSAAEVDPPVREQLGRKGLPSFGRGTTSWRLPRCKILHDVRVPHQALIVPREDGFVTEDLRAVVVAASSRRICGQAAAAHGMRPGGAADVG